MAGKEEKPIMSGSEESLSQVSEGDEEPKALISSFQREVLISAKSLFISKS